MPDISGFSDLPVRALKPPVWLPPRGGFRFRGVLGSARDSFLFCSCNTRIRRPSQTLRADLDLALPLVAHQLRVGAAIMVMEAQRDRP